MRIYYLTAAPRHALWASSLLGPFNACRAPDSVIFKIYVNQAIIFTHCKTFEQSVSIILHPNKLNLTRKLPHGFSTNRAHSFTVGQKSTGEIN